MADRPCVFVSSTFYDLRHLRADLRDCIDQLGFEPLLSEFPSFPVDPDLHTIEACKKVVAEKADILVLVVGGRYGSVDHDGRSVTNLEYLEAKAKGIPTYVFVDKAVKAILPVWKQNPDGDFRQVVDTPKLFEFVDALFSSGETWVFPFESAADIKTTLLHQWPQLIKDCLLLRRRFKSTGPSPVVTRLQGSSLRLFIERPNGWEALLLASLLDDELRATEDLRRDLTYDLSEGPIPVTLEAQGAIGWVRAQPAMAVRLAAEVRTLLERAIMDGFGPPGTPTNVDALVYAVTRWGALYRFAISQAIDCRRRLLPDGFERVAAIMGRIWTQVIDDIYCGTAEMRDLFTRVGQGLTNKLEYTLTLRSPDLSDLETELGRLREILDDPT